MYKKEVTKTDLALKIIKYTVCTCILFLLAVGINFNDEPPVPDYVRIFDVGQADCILITSGDKAALIDTGTGAGAQSIMQKLKENGVEKLDVLILTHPHSDHIGSASFILSKMKVSNIVATDETPNNDAELESFDAFRKNASQMQVPYFTASAGMVIKIGNFELTVLQYDTALEEENDRSMIIMAENNGIKFLLMGDAGIQAEEKLIKDNINVNCDVLKVGHHGSNKSSSEEFLKKASPEYSVISVGRENTYGHPGREAMLRLVQSSETVLRTDYMGDVVFSVLDGKLNVE